MNITQNASASSKPGPTPANSTGVVRIGNATMPAAPARAGPALVTFSPGARTVWNTHPAGQTIVLTAEQGWVQREGSPIETVGPGDTAFFEPSEKHLHGATADGGMTHVAVTEAVDCKAVDWLEQTSDEQHAGGGA